MDLDSIKKVWQETEVKPTIGNDKIQQMLDNAGKSAISSLIRWEWIGLFVCLMCAPLSFVFEDSVSIVVFLLSLFAISCWQVYKCLYLKKINQLEMNIVDISLRITTYKRYISREFIYGVVWTIFFMGLWFFRVIFCGITNISLKFTHISMMNALLVYVISVLVIVIFTWILYRSLYSSKIESIEKSIREIREFQEET